MLCTCTATLANGEHRALLFPDERQCTVLDYAAVSVHCTRYILQSSNLREQERKSCSKTSTYLGRCNQLDLRTLHVSLCPPVTRPDFFLLTGEV